MFVETTLCVCFRVHVERWGVCVCGVMVVCVRRESQGCVSGRSADSVCVDFHMGMGVCVCLCVCDCVRLFVRRTGCLCLFVWAPMERLGCIWVCVEKGVCGCRYMNSVCIAGGGVCV